MGKVINAFGTVFGWIFSVFCILTLPIMGFSVGAVIAFIIGILALPVKPIRGFWKKISNQKKWLKPVTLCLAFFISMGNIGQNDLESANDKEQKTTEASIEDEENTTKIEMEEDSSETEKISEDNMVEEEPTTEVYISTKPTITLADIPEYSGSSFVSVNSNVPKFKDTELLTESMEFYSELDNLGRCGVVYACIGPDIMPTEERGEIGQVKPTGWHTVKYNGVVDGNYLYNRCHLIGFQLTGENANAKNLITGTRSMNVDGMLPFENMVADYVKETGNHVMYRVTPMFDGDNLLVSGVLMEAKSVEDDGEGILFNVFVYNVQDGIVIDYATGDSELKEEPATEEPTTSEPATEKITEPVTEAPTTQPPTEPKTEAPTTTQSPTTATQQGGVVIGNKNSKAYHTPYCSRLPMEKNRVYFDSEAEANAAGYDNPCDYCNP